MRWYGCSATTAATRPFRQRGTSPDGHPPGNRPDNATADEHGYYGFECERVITNAMCLIEHGFVSEPTEHSWLDAHVGDLAHAEYVALCRHFGIAPARGSR